MKMLATLGTIAVLASCTHGTGATPTLSASPSGSTPTATPGPSYGGDAVAWPFRARATPAPRALGAIVTVARAPLADGRALHAGVTMPRVGGTDARPVVETPCANRVTLAGGGFVAIPPASGADEVVLIDPGHGGIESGATAPDGTPESARTLQVALLAARDLEGAGARVVLTRTTDRTTQLGFRVALGDALNATLAISIHFNAGSDGTSTHPGTETFGSISDPNGRRVAGVMFEAERRYLDTLAGSFHGLWAANTDAGARYRIGSHGDFYRQLRESHVTWVISESLFISHEPEARLLARASVRRGLARAIADGALAYMRTSAPGSGWREPVDRGDPNAPPDPPCTDPID